MPKIYQSNPVKEYQIICHTDRDLSSYGLPADYEDAKAGLLQYRKDYPNDKFQLVAIIDA
jgi:hypothetical protein